MNFRKRVLLMVCLMIIGLTTAAAGFALAANRQKPAQEPQWLDRLIRIHVIANSDTADDQALKLAVRDAVMDKMASVFEQAATPDEAAAAIRSHLGEMEAIAAAAIKRWGAHHPVQAQFDTFTFPERHLGEVLLPAGDYTALRIVIGEGAGQNWFTVLWPQLTPSWAAQLYVELPDGTLVKPVYLDEEMMKHLEIRAHSRVWDYIKSHWNR